MSVRSEEEQRIEVLLIFTLILVSNWVFSKALYVMVAMVMAVVEWRGRGTMSTTIYKCVLYCTMMTTICKCVLHDVLLSLVSIHKKSVRENSHVVLPNPCKASHFCGYSVNMRVDLCSFCFLLPNDRQHGNKDHCFCTFY